MLETFVNNVIEISKYITIFSFLFSGKWYKGKRKIVSCLIVIAGYLLEFYLINKKITFVSAIYILAIILLLYNGKIKNKIVLYIMTLIGVNYIDTFVFIILGYINKRKIWWYYINNDSGAKCLANIISISMIIIIVLLCHRYIPKNYLNRHIEILQCGLLSLGMLSLYFIFIIMMMTMAYGHPQNKGRLYIVIATASTLTIACILSFFLYSSHLKRQNDYQIENIELQKRSDGMRQALFSGVQKMDEDMRKYRHDFRHHVAALGELAAEGEVQEIQDYLAQLSGQSDEMKKNNILYTGNYMVDAVINGILASKKYQDVTFHCEGKLPRTLQIRDVDLSGLLSNGLENALEACIKSNTDKCVMLKAACYENVVHFQIQNTYDASGYKKLRKGNFETTKGDTEYHGYGISSMRRIVKSYAGRLEYTIESDFVITDIFLQQKAERDIDKASSLVL